MPPPDRDYRPVPVWLILVALAGGASLSLFALTEQDGVEGALVLAGIVVYPRESPQGLYYFGVWTFLHQLGAVALLAGIPQVVLDYVYSMAPVALRCAGYAMFIYGFSRRPRFSILGALACYASGFLLDSFGSPDYSVRGRLGVPVPYTYGTFAYGLATWTVGAWAGGRNFLAGISAAILIAAHPVIGCYVAGIMIAIFVLNRVAQLDLPIGGTARGLAVGSVLTLLSLCGYLAMSPSRGVVDSASFAAYLRYWDGHRGSPFHLPVVFATLMAIGLFAIVLTRPAEQRSSASVASLFLLLAACVSGLLYLAIHMLPPSLLPTILVSAMPGRLLDIHASLAGPAALGVAVWTLDRVVVRTAAHTAANQLLKRGWPLLQSALLLVALLVPGNLSKGIAAGREQLQTRGMRVGMASAFWSEVRRADANGAILTSYYSSVPALHHGHLQVLLNTTAINFVGYIPRAASAVAKIVTRGYGMSFLNPPPRARELIMDERPYWSHLTRREWSTLGGDLGFVGVVAPSDWHLDLPLRVKGADFNLYVLSYNPRN